MSQWGREPVGTGKMDFLVSLVAQKCHRDTKKATFPVPIGSVDIITNQHIKYNLLVKLGGPMNEYFTFLRNLVSKILHRLQKNAIIFVFHIEKFRKETNHAGHFTLF